MLVHSTIIAEIGEEVLNYLNTGKPTSTTEDYGKYSKISNIFFFLFSKKMWIVKAGFHDILVQIANREDPDQTASKEAV